MLKKLSFIAMLSFVVVRVGLLIYVFMKAPITGSLVLSGTILLFVRMAWVSLFGALSALSFYEYLKGKNP